MARRSGPAFPSRQKRPWPSRAPEEREWRTQQRYLKVLREVKEECGDTALSSDEEGVCFWAPRACVHLHRCCLSAWSQWVPFPHPCDEEAMPVPCGLSGPVVELGAPGPRALRRFRWVAVTADHFALGAWVPAGLPQAL